ncbi:hypothetical protein GCM10029964_114070 [Kibdelosporangium lantanae]
MTNVHAMDAYTPTPRPCWIAGQPEQGVSALTVTHPYDGSEVATVAVPGPEQIDRAVDAAVAVAKELRARPRTSGRPRLSTCRVAWPSRPRSWPS